MRAECYGCVGMPDTTKEDHMHQYINIRGEAVMGWFVSGRFSTEMSEAIDDVEKIYDVPRAEAIRYVNSIPKKYN
jgi:hypothetical protein